MKNTEKLTFRLLPCPSAECLYAASTEDLPSTVPDNVCLVADISDRDAETTLLALEVSLGGRLFVPDIWQNVLQQAGILISSSLSGGTLESRLQEASCAAPGRCWLLLEPVRMRFPLPCPSGTGIPLPADMLHVLIDNRPSFYSRELCCQYCYDLPKGIILYDTEETRQEKLRLAEKNGLNGAIVLPWSCSQA